MKSAASLVVLASSAAAFSPSISHGSRVTSLAAKHANNKAAKKANHDRPRKSRPSDIHRTPVVYDEIVKPPEYTIVDNGSSPESLPEEIYVQAKFGNNLGMIMTGDEHTGWVAKAGSFVQGTFEPIDWANMPQTNAVSNEPAEDDVLSWLNAQDHETAMAWIQNKIDTVEPVKLSKEEFETKLEENQVGDVNEIKERIMAASGENAEGGEDEGTSDGFNLPEGAELMDIVDDQVLVFDK